jgi:hypothetical protein
MLAESTTNTVEYSDHKLTKYKEKDHHTEFSIQKNDLEEMEAVYLWSYDLLVFII